MVAINNDLVDIPSVNFGVQGSDVSAPGAGRGQVYVKSNGVWYILNGGTATRLTDNPMTTAGDLILSGASGAPTRLAKGNDGEILTVDPATHLPLWASAPNPYGTELLRYRPTTDLLTNYAMTAGVWFDVCSNQNITVVSGASQIIVDAAVGVTMGNAANVNNGFGRIVVDSGGTPAYYSLGSAGGPSGLWAGRSLACSNLGIGSLSAGVHTIKIQCMNDNANQQCQCRIATFPSNEFLNLVVREV